METIGKHEIGIAIAESTEKSHFLELIDRSFGCGPGQTMRQVCPVALAEENHRHHFMLHRGGELVSTAAALRRTWHSSWGPVEAAVVGCFATEPRWRGHGLSRQLQEFLLRSLAQEGCDVAVLWTDAPEIYRARGFEPCGQETHLDLQDLGPVDHGEGGTRWATPSDAASLARLHERHLWRVERSLSDWRHFLEPGVSQVLVAETSDGVEAYAALGKGIDFGAYVHDYAGAPSAVHDLWSQLRAHGARFALVPQGAENYLEGRAASCPRRSQSSAWACGLSSEFQKRELSEWGFAAWGFDSA